MSDDNDSVRRAWNTNAHFWDERMGEGNEFLNVLVWPAVERLLPAAAGARFLDVACGNGVTSRRLAKMGANVVAIDFSEKLIDLAKQRTQSQAVDYRVLDATDYDALLTLGQGSFHAALCNMALMDMADLGPLLKALPRLLLPNSPFVFSMLHPCFNNPATVQVGELEDREGSMEMIYSVKISRYLAPFTRLGVAIFGQPVPHPYFHRPLGALLGACFAAGFVLESLEERAFPKDHPPGTAALSWGGSFSEIPPVLVARLLLMGRT